MDILRESLVVRIAWPKPISMAAIVASFVDEDKIRLRFDLRNAKLYSFGFHDASPGGAENRR
jgi:hypothetical protein